MIFLIWYLIGFIFLVCAGILINLADDKKVLLDAGDLIVYLICAVIGPFHFITFVYGLGRRATSDYVDHMPIIKRIKKD
jgi:tetrahydromethanopterin S-methyltransferase subunit D